MGKSIKQIFLPLIFMLLIGSCNEKAQYYTLDVPADQMKVTASAENVVLERVDETKEAVTFSWNTATDRGADAKLVYYFRLSLAEKSDQQSELIRIDEGVKSITWSVRELNNLLHAWNVTPGDKVTIQAEVLAAVESSSQYMKPEVSKTTFNATGYDTSNKLYLTIKDNSQKRNVEMNMLSEGVFSWSGALDVSNFWFVRNSEKGAPAYMMGTSQNSLVYSSSGEGNPFVIDKSATYSITVDINTLEITIKEIAPPSKLYMITSINGVESVEELAIVQSGRSIFYLKETFQEGTEFRFVEDKDTSWPAYVKGDGDTKIELKEKAGAEMFKVTKTATYVMTVNMETLSLIFLDVYVSPTGAIAVVGDAVSDAAWDAGVAIKNCTLTQKDLINNPEVISYTGKFEYKSSGSQNSFKFTGDKNWNSGLFALTAGANPFDSSQQAVSTSSSGDKKWTLPAGTATGVYTLELNLHTMKINLVKQ